MREVININGTTLLLFPFKTRETASLGVFFRIGSRFESKKVKGIAHFLEHMVFKGSKKYSHRKIKEEIEGRGGSLNAFTSQEMTGYYAHFLNKNLPQTLDILLDMVFNPILSKKDTEKERKVILEEIKMYNDLPTSRASMLFDRLLWKNHPLGEDVIGSVSTVKNTKSSDLAKFKNKYYIPSNTIISFSGAFAKEKVIKLLKEKIRPAKQKVILRSPMPQAFKGLGIACEKRSIEQTHLCLGFRGVSYLDKRRLTLSLINVILGANMSSRLFEELREKKSLCYDISTEARKYKDSGAFLIHIGLDKSKILVAISTIIRELNKIKKKEVPSKELSRAKDYLLGQIAMNSERPQGVMFQMAESYLTLGRTYSFAEIKKKVEAITALEIKRLANDLFKFKNICISCVGNMDDNLPKRLKEALKIYRNIK